MTSLTKDLFLCHNGADKDWTRVLGEQVEQEDWAGRKLTVFFDEWDIEPGGNILLKIDEGLRSSRFVGLVLSPEMLRSDWCSLEWTAILSADPVNRLGRLVPLLRRDLDMATGQRIDIPPILRPFNYIDFRNDNARSRGYTRLLAKVRGEAPPRGAARGAGRGLVGSAAHAAPVLATFAAERQEPDSIQETLISNLLPVCDMPKVVWSAATSLKSKTDLPRGNALPPFILRENYIYTFADLSRPDHAFTPWLSRHEWKRSAVTDWRTDPDRWRWVIELLNLSLKGHLATRGIAFDPDTKRFYFRPRKPGRSVRLKWGAGTKRTVVRAPDAEKGGYWVHQGARLSFETLGNRLFLAVEPCWVFTTDGRNSVRKQDIGPLAMQWGGKERNGAIVRHVLMWSDVLTNGHRTGHIPCGDRPIVIGRLPATVGMGVGVADDQVAIKALLKFTTAEQELDVPEDVVFGYLDDADEGGPDDDDTHEAA